jgi:heavy metal sensor kinase
VTLPLRARLAASYTAFVALLLVVLSVVSYSVLARQLDQDATTRLTELTDGLHGYLRVDGDMPTLAFDTSDADQATFIHEATRYYQIYDAETGRLIVQSAGFEPLGLHFTPAEIRTLRQEPRRFDINTQYGRFRISNSLLTRGTGHAQLLQVGLSLGTIDGALRRYLDLLRWRLPVALGAAALAAYWLAGVALAPLARLADAASAIDVNSLGQRLPARGTDDELDEVARAFNGTLARLERAVTEMRQFSAALAHELRTPLAALRGEIELALRSVRPGDAQGLSLGSQLEEIDKLNRLIDQILTMARAESGQIPLTFAPLDLPELGARVVGELEALAETRGIALRSEVPSAIVIDGDAGWLQRLMLNLLDNALKFTSAGGRVTLRVSRDRDAARLEVADTGIGMSVDVLARLFEPFFRADPARSSTVDGAGLGLSLVKWIVDAHQGRIAVASRQGEGSAFTVWLPLTHRDISAAELPRH